MQPQLDSNSDEITAQQQVEHYTRLSSRYTTMSLLEEDSGDALITH